MSTLPERKANEVFDQFVTAFLNGESPKAKAFVDRCPTTEQSRIDDAIKGFLFAYENYASCRISEAVMESAVARLQSVRRRKQRLAQARARAAIQPWELMVTQPLVELASILYPEHARGSAPTAPTDAPGIVILNRDSAASGIKPGQGLDEFARRGAERLAEREAERLLVRADVKRAPVPLDEIAEQLCVFVQEAPMRDLDGCIVSDGETAGILLNSLVTDSRRKRFTFAHEIGHFILHRHARRQVQQRDVRRERAEGIQTSNKDSEIFNFSDHEGEVYNPKSRQELEASAFASYLLMPPALLPPEFGREVPTFELAERVSTDFEVSLMAVLRRLVRESHHRTVFISSEGGRTRMSEFSSEIQGYNRIVSHLPRGSAAWDLCNDNAVDTYIRELPARVWLESGRLVSEGVSVMEESRRFSTGYVYTLITIVEETKP